MKQLYIIFLLALPMTFINSQDLPTNLISNGNFDTDITAADWVIVNPGAGSGFDTDIDRNSSSTSGSLKLVKEAGKFLHIKHTVSSSDRKSVGNGGNYTMTFWLKTDAAYKRVKVGVYYDSNLYYGTFNENTVNGDNTITRTSAADTWQEVTTTFNLADDKQVSFRIYPNSDGTTYHVDDISVKRSVSEMPASGDLATGWYPNNATSTVDSGTGVHTLNMDDASPQLKSWDYTVNADVSKIITIQLKNNSANDALTVMHAKADGSGTRYFNTPITTNDTAVKTYEIDMTNANWAGTIYPITLFVRQSNGSGGYTTANQSGTVEFHAITVSPTASVDENHQSTIVLYPNPADTYFIVDNVAANDKLEIYNVAGKLVKSLVIQSNNERISIEDLSSGIYFAKINERKALRLIKK